MLDPLQHHHPVVPPFNQRSFWNSQSQILPYPADKLKICEKYLIKIPGNT